ncbi:GH12 family glycosyl hydrolase domain-containing protein [Streptomyces sp. NPDC002521]
MHRSASQARRAHALLSALLTTLVAVAALLTAASTSHADTTVCEQFGSTTIGGRYVVQNNRWNTSEPQCVSATDNGFRVVQADGSVPTTGAPKSYPSVFNGCHYTNCSPGTNLPAVLGSIAAAPTSISYNYVSGAIYDAAYDIWLDPTPRTDGVNRTEIMIWFNRVGAVQPVGSQVGSVTVAGRPWQLWSGNNGSNDVLTFVAPSAIGSWNFDVMDFARQAVARGLAQNNWYLTSVQAGFEPWQNGAGLAVTSFSSTVGLGSGPPSGPTACKVAYSTNTWQGGYTADITLTNTGSSPADGWHLAFTLPAGQQITSTWNAGISPSSGAVTADGLAYNASLSPGAQVSFGYQATYNGSFAKPTAFSLNGLSCSVA